MVIVVVVVDICSSLCCTSSAVFLWVLNSDAKVVSVAIIGWFNVVFTLWVESTVSVYQTLQSTVEALR